MSSIRRKFYREFKIEAILYKYTLGFVVIRFFLREENHAMPEQTIHFAGIIPTHNENFFLERLLKSLIRLDY